MKYDAVEIYERAAACGGVHGKPSREGVEVWFDGIDDGLVLADNLLPAWPAVSLGIRFRPESGGAEEQRFLHIGEKDGPRFLLETRTMDNGLWCLDTYLETSGGKAIMIDRALAHPLDRFYEVRVDLSAAGIAVHVDGEKELTADLPYEPPTKGGFSLGVRQNLVSWFKGCVAWIEFRRMD